jgi:predicted acyltransferase
VKNRIASVDAYRGFVMFLMLAEVLQICTVSAAIPSSGIWALLCYEQTHAAWQGTSLHDLIQPSFYFLVGVGLAASLERRSTVRQSKIRLITHVLSRAATLIILGMALISVHPRRWNWWWVDTLAQIGLAYPLLVVIALRPRMYRGLALAAVLVGYWLWFASFPLPAANFDYVAAGVPVDWLASHRLEGFAAHWQKNSNAAWAFDLWFMNLFPRDVAYTGAVEGLATLNFIPSIGTMILGLFAWDVIRRRDTPPRTVTILATIGAGLLISGYLLGLSGVAPVVKAIWTPSWVLFSGGWCFLILAAFYGIVDGLGQRRLAFPLVVVGMNSLLAYSLSHLYPALAFDSWYHIFGTRVFQIFGEVYQPVLYGATVMLSYWLVLYALYRRRIFVRV